MQAHQAKVSPVKLLSDTRTILLLNTKDSAPPTGESGNVKQPDSDSSPSTDVKLVVAPRSGGWQPVHFQTFQ